MTWTRHHVIIRRALAALPILHAWPAHPTLPQFLAATDLSTVSMVSASPGCHNVGTVPSAAFSDWLPSLGSDGDGASLSFPGEMAHFLLMLDPLHRHSSADGPPLVCWLGAPPPPRTTWSGAREPVSGLFGYGRCSSGLPAPPIPEYAPGREGSPELSKLFSSIRSFQASAHETPQRYQVPQTLPSVLDHSPQA